MFNYRILSVLAVLLLLLLLVVPCGMADQQPIIPDTVGGTNPLPGSIPSGGVKPLSNGGILYLTSLDIGDGTFAAYDPATDTWTTLSNFDTGCQMAVSGDGSLYAHNYFGGTIDVYDPVSDTWSMVIAGPPGASGQYCNLEITAWGEFLYTEWNSATSWYTSGGSWNTMPLPFVGNAMGDYDPADHEYVVGQKFTTNAHLIDLYTWTITDFTSGVPNGEYARFGVVMNNRYFFEAGGSNIHSFDLSNPMLPPYDHGVSATWYGAAAADRANGVIYVTSLDSNGLWSFDPATNTLTPLTPLSAYTWHTSVAFAVKDRPDLIVSYLNAKIQKIGSLIGRVLVQYRVKNIGDAKADGSYIAFYLSKDTVLDAGDVYLGEAYIPPLSSDYEAPLPVGTQGFRLNNPVFWQVPSTWYVIAVADAGNDNDESDETNNKATTVATIVVK